MPWYPITSAFWRAKLAWTAISRPREGWLGPEQIEAWCTFYLDEERSGSSRPTEEFAAMLCAHGAPDCGNPIANDQEAHFLLHPGGFIAGEIDRCLRPAQSALESLRGERALDRLGLLAHVNCPMQSARTYWSDEDVRFALAISAMEGRWELFGARPARVVVQAMRHGLIEPMVAPGILIARRIQEQAIHPSPWSRLLRLLPTLRSTPKESLPPPPELDLGSWRAARQKSAHPIPVADVPEELP